MGRGEFEAGRSKERVAGKKGYARVLTGGPDGRNTGIRRRRRGADGLRAVRARFYLRREALAQAHASARLRPLRKSTTRCASSTVRHLGKQCGYASRHLLPEGTRS